MKSRVGGGRRSTSTLLPAVGLVVATVWLPRPVSANAQELEPRSYSAAPTGTTFVIGGIGRSQGPILMDPSLDVDNVQGDLWIATPGFGYVFNLAGRQARILAVAPIAWGRIEGQVGGLLQHQGLAGMVDPRIKLSIGFYGAPALNAAEFARAPRSRTVLGASVTVVPPWGQYQPGQLANLGFNRWAVKPEVGVSHQIDRWTVEWYAGTWLFTANDNYFPSRAVKQQDPVFAAQTHVSYALAPKSSLAVNATWFAGGQTSIDRVVSPDEQRNSRLGAVYSFSLSKRQSIKIVYSTGASTRQGSAFNTFNVTWQLVNARTH